MIGTLADEVPDQARLSLCPLFNSIIVEPIFNDPFTILVC